MSSLSCRGAKFHSTSINLWMDMVNETILRIHLSRDGSRKAQKTSALGLLTGRGGRLSYDISEKKFESLE